MSEHYKHGIEAIDVIHSWDLNFNLGNVIKYIARHKHKGTPMEDLEKALWYLEDHLERLRVSASWDNTFKNKAEQMYENTITGTTHLG
jgi:hypothetical protein